MLAALIVGGQMIWIWLLRGQRILYRDAILIGGELALSCALILLAVLLKTTPADAIRLKQDASAWLIVGGTFVLQAWAIVFLAPALSDDVVRYRLDGAMWLAGVSPYATTPAEFTRKDDIDRLVSYPQTRTIYPPVAEAVFASARAIERGLLGDTHAPEIQSWRDDVAQLPLRERALIFRAIFGASAVAAALVLVGLLTETRNSPWWAILLCWNPLFTLEAGGMGHLDVVGVFLIAVLLWVLHRRHFGWAGILLALVVGIKPFAIVLFPFVSTRPRTWLACGGALALLFIPAMLYQHGYTGWFATLHDYGERWEANGSIYELFKWAFGAGDVGRAMARAKDAARLFGIIAMLGTFSLLWHFRAGVATAGYWLNLVLWLVSPVVYPWYLVWVLVFVPLLRGRAGWTALIWCATSSVSYLLWRRSDWTLGSAATCGEYVLVYLALVGEIGWLVRWRSDIAAEAAMPT